MEASAPVSRVKSSSRRESLRCSALPRPHSMTVTDFSSENSRSRSSNSSALESRYASTCTRSGPPGRVPSSRLGCTRESTKVGEITPSRTPSPSPRARVKVVFPAPSSPESKSKSPAVSNGASACAAARVCARSARSTSKTGCACMGFFPGNGTG